MVRAGAARYIVGMIWWFLLSCERAIPLDPVGVDTETPAGTEQPGLDWSRLTAPITVYAVRHAEKGDTGLDPGLTEAGQAQAESLAAAMEGAELSAVYATDLRRTQETVAPTAAAHGLPVVEVLQAEADDVLAQRIVDSHSGQGVLHAGHSYTLPGFFGAFGLDPSPSVSGYGQLWTILLAPGSAPAVEEGRYAADVGDSGTGDSGTGTGDSGAP